MSKISSIVHELKLAGQLAGRTLYKRLRGELEPEPDRVAFLQTCQQWLENVEATNLKASAQVDVSANQPPWLDTGMDVKKGEQITWLACGRVYLSRALDIWVAPRFQLWARVGEQGPVLAGTRNTHSFRAQQSGRLYLASYFPGEWAEPDGRLATDPAEYSKASGGIAVQLLQWRDGIEPVTALTEMKTGAPPQAADEIARLNSKNAVPENWSYLWFLGPAEIYQASGENSEQPSICCRTEADVGILRTDLELPLTPDTELCWDWRVNRLPSDLAEDTLPTHDYLSIAVEFDNGQDITWYWSAELPVETIYTCPLPTWKHREIHIVIRSGKQGLGEWHSESRNVYQDCINALGLPAERIVRVWLIANSLFQRKPGDCEYRNIRVIAGGQIHRV